MRLIHGDAIAVLRQLRAEGVGWDYCLTSPPYFAQVDYECSGQHGLEVGVQAYIDQLVQVFDLVYDGLSEGGVCWIVIGDTSNNYSPIRTKQSRRKANAWTYRRRLENDFREKEPLMVPYRLAMALRARGWTLRKQLIWDKGQSSQVRRGDAPAENHESILMMGKAAGTGRPYFNTQPLKSSVLRYSPVKHSLHPCTFPSALVEELLGCCTRLGTVLDPYAGVGTTLAVAKMLGMSALGIELNEAFLSEIREIRA